MLVLAALLCVLVLVAALFVQRTRGEAGQDAGEPAPPRSIRHELLGAAFVLLSAVPLFELAPWVHGPPLTLWGDVTSHVRVAAEIARTGIPNGWIDSYGGGFPFGHHYPQLGWALLAAGIRLGLSPAAAGHLLGFAGTLAAPLVLYVALLRGGCRPAFAAVGGAFLGWVSPYNGFVGGYEAFYSAGLLSQTLALPLCIWLAAATLLPAHRCEVAVASWVSTASHPQLTVATLALLGVSTLVSGSRAGIVRVGWTFTFALIAAAALYGQGMASLDIPFGWPPDLGWRQLGFQPDRLGLWLLEGELLDRGRAPVLTVLLSSAALVLVLGAGRRANRGLVLALAASLLLGVSGRSLLSLGSLGAGLIAFLQPLRVVALVPPLAAAAVAMALDFGIPLLARALTRAGWALAARLTSGAALVLVVALAASAVPQRLRYASGLAAILGQGALSCSGVEPVPDGYDANAVRGWLASLSGGKLWFDAQRKSRLSICFRLDGLDLASAVPVGTAGGVGAHVGVLARASQFLAPEREGSAARAEALGIRYLLLEHTGALGGWDVAAQRGPVQLLSQPASNVGVGCVTRRWRADPRSLRARVNEALGTPSGADLLLDPHHYVALEYAHGAFTESEEPVSGCHSETAVVDVVAEEPGHIQAVVQNEAPVDVVFRAAAFPTWRVSIDGVPASATTLVAPGFFSVRVAPGQHRLVARASLLPGYAGIVALGVLASAVLASGAALRVLRRIGPLRRRVIQGR